MENNEFEAESYSNVQEGPLDDEPVPHTFAKNDNGDFLYDYNI